jgi:hypothetical protein
LSPLVEPGVNSGSQCFCSPLDEGGLPEHRSEHQAPRRQTLAIIPSAVAEPPSERSVFGEPARNDRRSAAHPMQELDRADVLHDFLHGSRPVGRLLGEHLPDQL